MAKDKKKKKEKKSKELLENSVDVVQEEVLEEASAEVELEDSNVVEEDSAPKAKKAVKKPAKKVEFSPTEISFEANFPVEKIVPREAATRFRGKETEAVLSEMIQKFGWIQPITLDSDYNIIDGQYRYELAKKWKLETVPALIVDSVLSKSEGTTDLYHMLSGRIIEWDKWNFPGTDAVLKSLDGGLTTEKVLGFETISEKGENRELAKKLGWFVEIVPLSLSGTTVTLNTLAKLLRKQLAGKYQYDPAQLLYIEAIREELEATRREMVAMGQLEGGVEPKLNRHINENEAQIENGDAIAAEKGYEMVIDEEAGVAKFTADAEIQYIIEKEARLEEAAKVQIQRASDMETAGMFKQNSDGKKVGLLSFKLLATYFWDMELKEAEDFFNGSTADEINELVDKIVEADRTIPVDRSKNFPLTEADLKAEEKRLQSETERKSGAKASAIKSLTIAQIKSKLDDLGVQYNKTAKKAELLALLEAPDSASLGVEETSEEPAASVVSEEVVSSDSDEENSSFDDADVEPEEVPMALSSDDSDDNLNEVADEAEKKSKKSKKSKKDKKSKKSKKKSKKD